MAKKELSKEKKDLIQIFSTPPAEVIERTKLKTLYINAHSIWSKDKRDLTSHGITNSGADVVAIAETMLDDTRLEFKVEGYELAANIVRKKGAGGLLLLVKKGIGIEIKDAISILPEVHLIVYSFNGFTYIVLYRSPSYSTKKENDQHKILVDHLNKTINKLGSDSMPILASKYKYPVDQQFCPSRNCPETPRGPPAGGPQIFWLKSLVIPAEYTKFKLITHKLKLEFHMHVWNYQ